MSPNLKAARTYGPIVHFMRHAEAENKPRPFPESEHRIYHTDIIDPKLNDAGRAHCKTFAEAHKLDTLHITHIYSSPLSRALQSSCLAFPDVVARGVKVVALAELQSLDDGPNGTGMNTRELEKAFNEDELPDSDQFREEGKVHLPKQGESSALEELRGKVDVSLVPAGWNLEDTSGSERWGWDNYEWRIEKLRFRLEGLSNGKVASSKHEVVVMSHGSFLKEFFEEERLSGRVRFGTLEMRSFGFILDRPGGQRKKWKKLTKEELREIRDTWGQEKTPEVNATEVSCPQQRVDGTPTITGNDRLPSMTACPTIDVDCSHPLDDKDFAVYDLKQEETELGKVELVAIEVKE